MSTQTHLEPALSATSAQPWPLARRVTFRFCVVYFGLYALSTHIFGSIFLIPKVDVPDPATLWPARLLVIWTAQHIFGVKSEIVYSGSGSGDKTFDWVLVFCLLVIAAIATAVWSAIDRKRSGYPVLARWAHLLLRIIVASQMLVYGLYKVIPIQMSSPALWQLVQPYGSKSPMGALWSFVGSSLPYETCTGCAELLGGLLLIFPGTVALGAIVCLFDMVQVFILNMTYDVPVKLFSFQMILMSLLLLAPQARRLSNFFLLGRAAEPAPSLALFETRRAGRITSVVLAFLWLWMIGNNVYNASTNWHESGGGGAKSALYGIWEIDELTRDGQIQPPLLTDDTRWRRAIFGSPNFMRLQKMDESFAGFSAAIDSKKNTLMLTKSGDKNWKANFIFLRTAPDRLSLQGSMDGHALTMRLHRIDETKFLLVSRGFNWIQEYPFSP
jgi:hypothetical protein